LLSSIELSVFPSSPASTTTSASISINATTTYFVNIQCNITNPITSLIFSAIRIS
jgi:hypothetical protein